LEQALGIDGLDHRIVINKVRVIPAQKFII